ncbi:hypothetical protein JOH52_006745 [Sinorhizobium meliloti]|nr:hypothetical protein [Sinorhizobium meliloti]
MTDGMPLPWPFPWSVAPASTTLSKVRDVTGFTQAMQVDPVGMAGQGFVEQIHAEANKCSQKFGKDLPPSLSRIRTLPHRSGVDRAGRGRWCISCTLCGNLSA